jgi:glycosyltransferase involved in cell wall biosynthesis
MPIDARVVAPVPWFPFKGERFGSYAKYAQTPAVEERGGIKVIHPRYAMAPGLGMYFQPYALAAGAYATVRSLQRDGFDFDLIDAHYFYPDGVAAALLARWFRKPLVITGRGTDINLLPSYTIPRRLILSAARQAQAVITVSGALKRRLEECGINSDHITVIRNGVDTEIFKPHTSEAISRELGLPGAPLLLSVGNLVPEKGHDLIIRALALMHSVRLVIVGEGPERTRLTNIAISAGVGNRVSFVPVRSQRELAPVYTAATALVLASSREGWPNVLLESMACGTPVVAADVGGVQEIVRSAKVGSVLAERTPQAIAAAVKELIAVPRDRGEVRLYAERFGWDSACSQLADLMDRVVHDATVQPATRAGAVL